MLKIPKNSWKIDDVCLFSDKTQTFFWNICQLFCRENEVTQRIQNSAWDLLALKSNKKFILVFELIKKILLTLVDLIKLKLLNIIWYHHSLFYSTFTSVSSDVKHGIFEWYIRTPASTYFSSTFSCFSSKTRDSDKSRIG